MNTPDWKSECGSILLYLGDCLDVMPRLAGPVDLILADLPYGTTACKWDTVIPFEPLWENYKRLIKPRGAIVVTASQPFTSALVMSNPEMFRYELIWDKKCGKAPGVAKHRPVPSHESVLIFCSGSHTYNPQWSFCNPYSKSSGNRDGKKNEHKFGYKGGFLSESDGRRYPLSVINFGPFVSVPGQHSTQKPTALMEYLIRTYTNEGETVLDNTMGSGTTGVACHNTGRKFIGIEKDPEIFETARKRIQNEMQCGPKPTINKSGESVFDRKDFLRRPSNRGSSTTKSFQSGLFD